MAAMEEGALDIALAGGAIATALLELLLENGSLSPQEARAVLDNAMIGLAPAGQRGIGARRIVAGLQAGKFAERG